MTSGNLSIVGKDFRVGFRLQTQWSWSMATAFFFGEIGAGLFFVSMLIDFEAGMLLGLVMTAGGKGTGHLLHLGRPERAWRAILGVRHSWVSRGLLAIVLYTGFGFLHLLNVHYGLLPGVVGALVVSIATAAAFVVMVYQGLAMSHSPAIAFWSTGLMPVASLTYSLLGGLSLAVVFGYFGPLAARPDLLSLLMAAEIGLLLYGLVIIASLLHAARYGSEGGRKSLELLLNAKSFVGVVVFVGFVATALLYVFGNGHFTMLLMAAATELSGYYAFRILMLKTGTYDPVLSHPSFSRRR